MSSLIKMYLNGNYNTDKYDLGYFELFYEDVLFSLKEKPISLLEIGVFGGGSIKLWKDYLHKDSKIFALDINKCEEIENLQNVTHMVCDAYEQENVDCFKNELFDLIIDDGPHTFESFVLLIQRYYNKLKPDGLMIIEDIIQTKWTPVLQTIAENTGYKNIKHIDAAGKQKTEHLLNLWSVGLDVLILTK